MAIPIGSNDRSDNLELSSFINRQYLEQQAVALGLKAFDNNAPVLVSPDRTEVSFRFQVPLKPNAALLSLPNAVESTWGVNKLQADPLDDFVDDDLIEFLALESFEAQYIWILSKLEELETIEGENQILIIPNYDLRRVSVIAAFPVNLSRVVEIVLNYLAGGEEMVAWSDITGDKLYSDLVGLPNLSIYQPISTAFSGSYVDLTDKPVLFSGDYNDLTNKPALIESIEYTYTPNSILNIPHGLGAIPQEWQVFLRCKTAEIGYSVGDEVPATYYYATGSTFTGINLSVDATNIRCLNSPNAIGLPSPVNLIAAVVTPSRWRIFARWRA